MLMRIFTFLAALLLTAGASTPAWSALSAVGDPIQPHGYPAFYEDGTGLQLELCVPPPAGNAAIREDLCIFDPLDVESDLIIAGESFWWIGDAHIELPSGGDALLVLAIEGTFGGAEEPVPGQQITFGRTRIRIDTPVAGTYTVTHPYGTQVFEVTDPAEGINYTADIGAANFLSPALGFAGTLSAPLGPFLTWPNYLADPTLKGFATDPETGLPTEEVLEQYVGDPNVAHTVVGSPTGNNFFRVDGPAASNLGGPDIDFVQTDLFAVMGKVYDSTVPQTVYDYAALGFPSQKLFAVGPVNRIAAFPTLSGLPSLVLTGPDMNGVTGIKHTYSVGYPIWYQEALPVLDGEGNPVLDELTGEPQTQGGLQLTLCTPGDAMCISDPIDPSDPLQSHPETGLLTGGEAFWWSADARADVPAGRALLVLGLEATFGGDESLQDGQQITFGRVRVRVDTDQAGTYRVTHPYGQLVFEDVPVDDSGINYTADIGIADPSDPDYALVGTLYSEIGPTFLKWDTFVDPSTPDAVLDPNLVTPHIDPATGEESGLSNYYVGNPGIEHAVVGSPLDTNFFRVEYLNDGEWETVAETDLFAVSGKLFDPTTFEFAIIANAPVAIADTANLDLNLASAVTIDVLDNDTFLAPATVALLPAGPDSGTAEVNADGNVTYTPDATLAADGGVDTFGYTLVDASTLTSNTAVVTVNVTPTEVLTIDRARLDTRRLRLDLRGTSNGTAALTIHAGGDTTGAAIGTVTPNNGRWSFRGTATGAIDQITVATPNTTVSSAVQTR